MKSCEYWFFDSFFQDAPAMRAQIEEHFSEEKGKKLSFEKRAIWNYWHIDKLYTYLRADPARFFPELYERFIKRLRVFAAREFGMVVSDAHLSMYINGCGQTLHNDSANGRLGYVFSLTKWKDRHFEGGETMIMKSDQELKAARLRGVSGPAFYHLVEPEFNRLVVFDDRIIHGVRHVQGTMDPLDSRLVIHGHFKEPQQIAWIQGPLKTDVIEAQWEQMRETVANVLRAYDFQGFLTFETSVKDTGHSSTTLKRAQLLPAGDVTGDFAKCLEDVLQAISKIEWPASNGSSTLIYTIPSHSLSYQWK